MCNPSHTAGGTHGIYLDGKRHPSQAQGAHPEEGSTMAIILIERRFPQRKIDQHF
jgi:hypothetical protein